MALTQIDATYRDLYAESLRKQILLLTDIVTMLSDGDFSSENPCRIDMIARLDRENDLTALLKWLETIEASVREVCTAPLEEG